MNGLERLSATMRGQFADRRAVGLTLSLYGARLTECPLPRYYSDPAAYMEGMRAVRDVFRPDWLTAPFNVTVEGEAFGSQSVIRGEQAPILVDPAIQTIEQIEGLSLPDVENHERLQYVRQAIRMMAAEFGQETPIAGIALSPVEMPALIMGLDGWMTTFLTGGINRQRMFALTVPFFVNWANALLSDGAMMLVVPALFANPKIITRELAERVICPIWEQAFAQVKGPILLHHGSNPLCPFSDLFADLPNVVGFVADPRDDLGTMRTAVGPGKMLVGGIDGPTLGSKSPAEIVQECLEVLEDRRDDPCFALATTAADIAYTTPQQNIHTVRETAEELSREALHAN